MDIHHQKKYGFSAISIKSEVAIRFRKFSKRIGHSHTDSLESMMDFFELNELSPNESLGVNMKTLENRLKKRINALVAIIRDIEKNQLKPTNAMLQLLFEENTQQETSSEDSFDFEQQVLISENEELSHYQSRYEEIQRQYLSIKYDLEKIVHKTSYVKNHFGGGYLKIDISKGEFEKLKEKL